MDLETNALRGLCLLELPFCGTLAYSCYRADVLHIRAMVDLSVPRDIVTLGIDARRNRICIVVLDLAHSRGFRPALAVQELTDVSYATEKSRTWERVGS